MYSLKQVAKHYLHYCVNILAGTEGKIGCATICKYDGVTTHLSTVLYVWRTMNGSNACAEGLEHLVDSALAPNHCTQATW
eukprot:5026173-Amphidinium_carterae.2